MDLFEALNALRNVNDNILIDVNVIVEPIIKESLPSDDLNDYYDDQTVEDWNDFTCNIEEIIENENNFKIIEVAHSAKAHKFSTYYNFIVNKEKNCLINLRVSDHSSSTSTKTNRKKYINKTLDALNIKRYKLYGITVNNKLYDSYDDALDAIRKIIDKIGD